MYNIFKIIKRIAFVIKMFLLNSKIKQIDLNLETHTFFKPDENLITVIIEIKQQ